MNSFSISHNNFNSSVGIDWKFISSISPSDLLLNNDKYTMRTIIQDFLNTQSFDEIPKDITVNFLYILQIIIKKLLENNKKAQKKLDNQKKINTDLRKKILIRNHDSDNGVMRDIMDNTIINKSQNQGILCPICLNCYTSLKYLDRHIFTHHIELSEIWQILRTPHYMGLTEDPTIKLMNASTDKIHLKQTIHALSEEAILEQKDNELKIKNRLRKKFNEVNNKLDQISSNMNQKSLNNLNDSYSYSKPNDSDNYEPNSSSSKVCYNKINNKITNYSSYKSSYDLSSNPKSQSTVEDEIVLNTSNNYNINYTTNNTNTNHSSPNNINLNNTNFTTSTNVFVISDSSVAENETKSKSSSVPVSYKASPTSPGSYQFSSSNMNRIE